MAQRTAWSLIRDEPHEPAATPPASGAGDSPTLPQSAADLTLRTPAGGGRPAPEHTTAFRLGKQYGEQWPVSTNPDKRSARQDDGHISSADYLRKRSAARQREAAQADLAGCRFDRDYHHWLEDVLGQFWMRKLLGYLTRSRRGRQTILEEAITSYGDPQATLSQRLRYWPVHRVIRHLMGATPLETFRRRIAEHTSTVRGLVLTARSVAEFGLSTPQRFSAPMFMVWNFTNLCNLRCRHCYQDTAHARLKDELTRAEKLDVVDQAGRLYIPMIAFAGGEPTLDRDLLPVLHRCKEWGMHTSVATHGGTITPKLAAQLAEAGASYIEVSLDSVHPERHDAFRGQPGMWERTMRGMRCIAQQPGLRLGVAMCVHQGNFAEVDDMIRLALDVGATSFAHFNFIPVGRGLNMVDGDLTPQQREQLLQTLNRWMQSGKIGVISTAPQLGKVCLAYAPLAGRTAASHCGSGAGWKARVVAKYLGGCGAGRCYIAIEPNGDVTPCVYLPHRIIGNVRQRRLAKMFRDNPYWEITCDRRRRLSHCEVCAFKSYCGGCLARSDAYYGVLNAGDPGCLFNAKHWEELVRTGVARQVASNAMDSRESLAPTTADEH